MRRSLAIISLTGLLAACGGGGDSNKDAYIDAIAATMQADDAPFDAEQANCIATGMVDAIGVDTIEEAGVTPEEIANDEDDSQFEKVTADISEEQANDLVDVIFGGECFSFGEVLASQMGEDGPDLSDDQIECIGDQFAKNETFKKAFVDSLITGEDNPDVDAALGDIFSIFGECDIDLADFGA